MKKLSLLFCIFSYTAMHCNQSTELKDWVELSKNLATIVKATEIYKYILNDFKNHFSDHDPETHGYLITLSEGDVNHAQSLLNLCYPQLTDITFVGADRDTHAHPSYNRVTVGRILNKPQPEKDYAILNALDTISNNRHIKNGFFKLIGAPLTVYGIKTGFNFTSKKIFDLLNNKLQPQQNGKLDKCLTQAKKLSYSLGHSRLTGLALYFFCCAQYNLHLQKNTFKSGVLKQDYTFDETSGPQKPWFHWFRQRKLTHAEMNVICKKTN